MQQIPKILMDERERGEMRNEMQSLPCELYIKTLDVGDFVLSRDIGIERKRGDDFVASLLDNRLFSQAMRMKQVFSHPLMIIENLPRAFHRNYIFPQSIYGAMTYLNYKLGISIFLSQNAQQTALMIWSLANHLNAQGIYPPTDLSFLAIRNDQITRINQLYFLQGLFDVGEKRSIQLLDLFETPAGVLKALENSTITYSKTGKQKGIEGPLSQCEGIGPKFFQNNAWIFQQLPLKIIRDNQDLVQILQRKINPSLEE